MRVRKSVNCDLDIFAAEELGLSIIFENPEHNLLAAVIERAIRDALGTTDYSYKEGLSMKFKREARAWIKSNLDVPWSYIWCIKELQWEHLFFRIRDLIDHPKPHYL